MHKLPRVLIDTEQQDWMILNGCWLVDSLTPDSHKSKAEETLQRVLAQAAEILGVWNLLTCLLHPKAKWRKHTKGYAKNELKEWSIMMVHVSPDENSVDTLHLEFFILSICNFGLYETCETSKRAYLTYLKPCSWLRASRIASLGAPWGLNQSQTALESQSSLVD